MICGLLLETSKKAFLLPIFYQYLFIPITNRLMAKFFNPIPFLYLGNFQPCTKKLKRQLKLDNIQG